MKVEKVRTNLFKVRKTINKKTYTVYFNHKPTQKEAETAILAKTSTLSSISKENIDKRFSEAYEAYIAIKKNVLSPATIRGYQTVYRQIPEWFTNLKLTDLEENHIQKVINDYSVGHSVKTVKNMLGLITPVIHTFNKKMEINITLPKEIKKEAYFPTEEDVKRILDYAKNSRYESCLLLACMGLRRSEIIALTEDSLKDNDVLVINSAIVQDENENWVLKTTKTEASTREILLPDNIAKRIREIGLYKGYPNSINKYLTKAQNNLNIPHFSLHKFRHYFATAVSSVLPEADVLKMGGWSKSNRSVMREVYRHSEYNRDIEKQKKAADKLSNLFNN